MALLFCHKWNILHFNHSCPNAKWEPFKFNVILLFNIQQSLCGEVSVSASYRVPKFNFSHVYQEYLKIIFFKVLFDLVIPVACIKIGIQTKLDFSKDALSRLEDKVDAVSRIHGCLGTDPGIYE